MTDDYRESHQNWVEMIAELRLLLRQHGGELTGASQFLRLLVSEDERAILLNALSFELEHSIGLSDVAAKKRAALAAYLDKARR